MALQARAHEARRLAERSADPLATASLVRLEHALLGVAWLAAMISSGNRARDP